MPKDNSKAARDRRREEAFQRQYAYDRTPLLQKIKHVEQKFTSGMGRSAKELTRLRAALAAEKVEVKA